MQFMRRNILALTGLMLTGSAMCTQKKKNKSCYIWGNGTYQARPDAILQFRNFQPKRIDTLSKGYNLKYLKFGTWFEAGIDQDGRLFIWPTKQLESNVSDEAKPETRENIVQLDNNIKEVHFTKGYVWALNNKGEVYQWEITRGLAQDGASKEIKIGARRHVQPFKDIVQLATGCTLLTYLEDHVAALDSNGEVHMMGNDTNGQCGQGQNGRNTHPPFIESRITYPEKVKNLPKIRKIVSGKNHVLAIDEAGSLYGWGSNSNMQLSHQQQFSRVKSPLLCSYSPIKITRNLDSNSIVDIAAGQQFSVVVSNNRDTSGMQIFSTGCNLKGQLGLGLIQHLKDITKIEMLSNYVYSKDGRQRKVSIEQIECGNNHCIALLNIGYIVQWGDNEYGQMGNKRRSPMNRPVLIKQFVDKKVTAVFASENSSGVIVEDN